MSGEYIELPAAGTVIRRVYADLAGVDISRQPSDVSPSRSPDALNVYKDYSSALGRAVQTRPGFVLTAAAEGRIYGIHSLGAHTLIHHGSKLSRAENWPDTVSSFTDMNIVMNEADSVSFLFGGRLYILDGLNYLVYDGESVAAVRDSAFVPTTRISADPDGANGEFYQGVNFLSPYRKNSFVSDGVSTVYSLDDTGLDSGESPEVTVNGETLSEGFTLEPAAGTVTFTTAPAAPYAAGCDNVVIKFKKTLNSAAPHISGCRLAAVFDNRVFVSGNTLYKGVLFHSELDDPTYFADESWYDDGKDGVGIKALICGTNTLYAVKADGGAGEKVFYHVPALDETYGKVYPSAAAGIALGAAAGGMNFTDDIVYISPGGLEGIAAAAGKVSLAHRSGNVDTRFANEDNISAMKTEVWQGYLLCMCNGRIYLADSRRRFASALGSEYEWFIWDNIGVYDSGTFYPGCVLKNIGGELFFGCENGALCRFAGTNDAGRAITSYWCTPADVFSRPAHLKTVKKRGGVAVVKRIPNSVIKIAAATDRSSFAPVKEARTGGFDFGRVSFADMAFATGLRGYVLYSVKRRNIWQFQLKFYSDEKDKPFGIYEAAAEFTVKRYMRN